MKAEGAALPEGPDLLIVAPPRQAKLNAVIFIFDTKAVANLGETVGDRQGVFRLVREVAHGRSEDRPVTMELHSPGQPEFLVIAKIFDRGVDVAVEQQVAKLDVGLLATERQVELIAAHGKVLLVDPIPVGEVDQPTESDSCSSYEI